MYTKYKTIPLKSHTAQRVSCLGTRYALRMLSNSFCLILGLFVVYIFICALFLIPPVGIRVWLFASVFLVTSFCVFSLVMVLNSCFIFVATLTAQFFARCFTPCVLLSYPNLWIQFCHLDFSFSLIEDVLGFLFFFLYQPAPSLHLSPSTCSS